MGASAGGLPAFKDFLRAVPQRAGIAYVLFQHLDPSGGSHLPEILGRATSLPVVAPRNGERLRADCVYVIGPEFLPEIAEGAFVLRPHSGTGASQYPIDHMFATLAKAMGDRAVGVVLSGTGSDGTTGMLEIKAAGGVTFAQDGATADQHAMPANAAAAGGVDFMLPPAAIAKRIGQMRRHPIVRSNGDTKAKDASINTSDFSTVLTLLRSRTSIDFTQYRDKTLKRRILRRMVLRNCPTVARYTKLLAAEPHEVDALFQDVLINVTGFFRDPEVFNALRKSVFPALARRKNAGKTIRAWTAGCSTGEEAYSLAITLLEYFDRGAKRIPIQVFATDINEGNLGKGRLGWFPSSIEASVSPERLRRFFRHEEGGYRVNKAVRDLVVFARHNLTTDPPFSRMDIITCRNVLIYLGPEAQRRILPGFHYALSDQGFLILGTSESALGSADLFATVDASRRIYRRRPHSPRIAPALLTDRLPRMPRLPPTLLASAQPLQQETDRILMSRYVPGSVVIDRVGEILQLRGRTEPFMQRSHGPSRSLFKLLKAPLRPIVEKLVAQVRRTGEAVEKSVVPVQGGARVSIHVTPVRMPRSSEATFLVVFEEDAASRRSTRLKVSLGGKGSKRTKSLEAQLRTARTSLQSVLEQQEAANEELRSANEEMVSSNEELQSTNEELETAKEELQSSNEELSTVNEELHQRNEQLDETNNDLANLLSSVKIPIIMLGPDRRIRHYTEAAGRVANIIPTDVGRPIAHLRTNLDLQDIDALAAQVLDTLEPIEREVRDSDGKWYVLRVRPYRTFDNRIDGAVLVLLDIDAAKRAQEQLRSSAEFARSIVDTFPHPVVILEPGLRVRTANAAFYRVFQVTPEQTEGRNWQELGRGQWDIPELATRLRGGLPADASGLTLEAFVDLPNLGRRTISITASGVAEHDDLILVALQDVTDERRHALELEKANKNLLEFDRRKSEFINMMAHDVRTPLTSMIASLEVVKNFADARAAPSMDVLDRNLQRLNRLADELINVVRLEGQGMTLRRDRVDLLSVARRAADALRDQATSKDVNVALQGTGRHVVLAPKDHLTHTVMNLVENAVRATPTGGNVQIRVLRQGPEEVVEVEDTGAGFDPKEAEAFFRPFEPHESSKGGAGLSLYVGASLANVLGGGIDATSPGKGKGAVFRLRIPAAPPIEKAEGRTKD